MTSPLPLVHLNTLHHTGTLDRRLSQQGAISHEGHHLSVTTEPDEWRRIARIRGVTWTLTRPGGVFIDGAAVDSSPDLQGALLRNAEQAGLVIREPAFEVWVDDPESGLRYSYARTWNDAVSDIICDHVDTCDELLSRLERDPHATYEDCLNVLPLVSGQPAARPVTRHLGTAKLLSEHGLRADFALTGALAHAARQAGLDGVWQERPVTQYDAPRGLILDERVHAWHAFTPTLRRTS